jgi:hypothetical protein
MEVSGQLHAPVALILRESTCTHYLGGWLAPKSVWTFRRREKVRAVVGIRALDRPARSLVTILTALLCKTVQYENLNMLVWMSSVASSYKGNFFSGKNKDSSSNQDKTQLIFSTVDQTLRH